MASTPTSGMGSQSRYKGMVTGGKSAQTGDYTAGAMTPHERLRPRAGKLVTGTVVSR